MWQNLASVAVMHFLAKLGIFGKIEVLQELSIPGKFVLNFFSMPGKINLTGII